MMKLCFLAIFTVVLIVVNVEWMMWSYSSEAILPSEGFEAMCNQNGLKCFIYCMLRQIGFSD